MENKPKSVLENLIPVWKDMQMTWVKLQVLINKSKENTMTKILSPEEMAEDLIKIYKDVSRGDINEGVIRDYERAYYGGENKPKRFKDIAVHSRLYHARKCALLQVEYMIYLFLGEKSCVPVQGQHLVMDISYWIQVRNKLKEHE